jgi:hypothetical protein
MLPERSLGVAEARSAVARQLSEACFLKAVHGVSDMNLQRLLEYNQRAADLSLKAEQLLAWGNEEMRSAEEEATGMYPCLFIMITIIIFNNNKHAYAGTNDCFPHIRVLLVLQTPRHWAQSIASVADGKRCPSLG